MLRASDHQEKKLKTTVSSHLTPVRTAIVNKPAHDSAGKDAEKREARGRLVGVHEGAASAEDSVGAPREIENRIADGPAIPL